MKFAPFITHLLSYCQSMVLLVAMSQKKEMVRVWCFSGNFWKLKSKCCESVWKREKKRRNKLCDVNIEQNANFSTSALTGMCNAIFRVGLHLTARAIHLYMSFFLSRTSCFSFSHFSTLFSSPSLSSSLSLSLYREWLVCLQYKCKYRSYDGTEFISFI